MGTIIAITKTRKTFREKVIFGLCVLLFTVLNLVPGLTGSYADAQYGGGGGGGDRCESWSDIGDPVVKHNFGMFGSCYQCTPQGCHSSIYYGYCVEWHAQC